jgi:hypothetical protein
LKNIGLDEEALTEALVILRQEPSFDAGEH